MLLQFKRNFSFLTLALCLLAGISLTACNNDNEAPTNGDPGLVQGRWTLVTTPLNSTQSGYTENWVLNADGTLTIQYTEARVDEETQEVEYYLVDENKDNRYTLNADYTIKVEFNVSAGAPNSIAGKYGVSADGLSIVGTWTLPEDNANNGASQTLALYRNNTQPK